MTKAEIDDIFGEFEIDEDYMIKTKDVIGLFVSVKEEPKVVELHKQLLVVLREGSEEDVKKHAADMEAQANAARKKVEEAKAGLKTALEGDIKPELKPEVVKLQRRAD